MLYFSTKLTRPLKIIILILPLITTVRLNAECPKNFIQNFEFVKSENTIDQYYSKSQALALTVKCEPTEMTFGKIYTSLGAKFKLTKGKNRIFYFDYNVNDVITRTYIVPTKPVMQLSFVSASSASNINDTLNIIENLPLKMTH